jgi:hypothetical protein
MKVSELIQKLTQAQLELGDVVVHCEGGAVSMVDAVWPDEETTEYVYLG